MGNPKTAMQALRKELGGQVGSPLTHAPLQTQLQVRTLAPAPPPAPAPALCLGRAVAWSLCLI